MTRRVTLRLLGAATALAAFGYEDSASAGRQLLVVVHRASPAANLSADAVKSHFLRQHKEWSSGEKVRPVQQESYLHAVFLSRVLKMSNVDYERYWLERKYSAAETPPKHVDDDAAVVKFVGAMNGAIGYVEASALDDKAKSNLKVVHAVNY